LPALRIERVPHAKKHIDHEMPRNPAARRVRATWAVGIACNSNAVILPERNACDDHQTYETMTAVATTGSRLRAQETWRSCNAQSPWRRTYRLA